MPMFKTIEEKEATGKVKEVFDDIKGSRGITEIPNFWKMLANDPNELERINKNIIDIPKNFFIYLF